jgi:hypothetical protein
MIWKNKNGSQLLANPLGVHKGVQVLWPDISNGPKLQFSLHKII